MNKEFRNTANQITLSRFLIILIMWILIFLRSPLYYIAIGLIICGISDFLDGFVARKLNQVSRLGSKLDTWADNLLLISGIIWTAMLMPEVFIENALVIAVVLGLYGFFILFGIIKFRRFANLHLYLFKITTFILYIFIVSAFFTGAYNRSFFLFTAGISIVSSIEGLIIYFILPEVNEHIGSILFLYIDEKNPVRLWFRKKFHGHSL